MIWLTWRQFRVQALGGFGALAVLAVVLAVTGPGIADRYASGIASCGSTDACERFTQNFFDNHQNVFVGLLAVVLLVPALIGLFWGAPLIAREIEAGTHRLVWNQSVTRTRWLAVKLGIIGVTAVVITGLVEFAVTWWIEPIAKAAGPQVPKMTPLLFDVRGIVSIAYAAFAFALGVTIGLLVRRVLQAMAITLAVFAALQIAMPLLVRAHLLPTTTVTTTITGDNVANFYSRGPGQPITVSVEPSDAGAWVLTNETVDKNGRVVKSVPVYFDRGPCLDRGAPGREGPPESCLAEINRLGYRQHLVYHGTNHFWPLQWIETGLYAVLTLGLAGFCFYRIRRNLS